MFLKEREKCVKCCGTETDIAVITEGIVKDIVAGNPVKLYRFMCNPLIWDSRGVIQNIKPFRFRRY
jgi:hypothetical protein